MTKHRDNFEKSNQRRSSAFYAISILCCLLLAGIVFICFRLRGGVQVKALRDGDILSGAEAVLYRQDDERWGDDRLGDSEYTMASSGCLVSCIASALSMEGGEEETPGSLNEKFSGMQAYDAEGNLQWQPLSEGGEYQVDVCGEVSADIIDACLSQGHYPIVRVRMYALGNIHYVLIVGAEDGEYLCMDPLRDEITKLSGYGSRVYAVRCVYYGEQSPQKEENAGWRYVSSEPWGFVGADGAALRPGASFLFYTPEATGQEPGTELYGAKKFLEWWPERREFVGESDKLGRYGLHNLETGHGFFSETMAD